MSDSIFTYKFTFSMKLKVFALFLLTFFTVFVAIVYSYSTKITADCAKIGSGIDIKHIITISSNINTSIIYKNHNYGNYVQIDIPDIKIINSAHVQNTSYIKNTIKFKLKTIFGIKSKSFSYKIKNIILPVTVYAIDSDNNYYEGSPDITNIITINSDVLTFKGKTIPNTTINLNNDETLLSDENGEFEIVEYIADDISDFTLKFKYKNLKPVKIDYNVEKIIQN